MCDLISRQDAIEAVQNRHMMLSKEKVLLINDLKKLPSEEPHWISVEQDLPKIGEYVLCETTERYFGKYHVCKFVDKDKWIDKPHFDWDRNGFPHVVAWTRFEPYKGVTE